MDKMYKVAIAVVVFVIAVLGCGITIYQTFHVPLAYAISQEKSDRVDADSVILKEARADRQEIAGAIADIRVMMAEIRTDIAYMKKESRNAHD